MKTALIVDDSRVARLVLRKTLVGFGIEVDEASSAEAAIEYLKFESPDIIFLDHMMPGMDGFDALSALKANPSTATIPVLMYTTQEGQLYVSQARALGAVDVLPKSVAPADVERVLRAHHLIGRAESAAPQNPGRATGAGAAAAPSPASRPVATDASVQNAQNTRELIESMRSIFDDRIVLLMSEVKRELHSVHRQHEARLRETLEEYRAPVTRPISGRLAIGSGLAALALVVAVGFPYLATEPSPVAHPGPPVASSSDLRPVAPPVAQATTLQEAAPIADALARGLNTTRPYPFGSVPLDDTRAREYGLLIAELKSDGFSGVVTFDVHEGRYCMSYAANGTMQLAAPEQPATTCDLIGTRARGAGEGVESPMFTNMIQSATRDGLIRVDMVSHGTADPIIDYPALDYSVTAANWNAIADINQRVSMRVMERPVELFESVASLSP